jgi:hypothetical protein
VEPSCYTCYPLAAPSRQDAVATQGTLTLLDLPQLLQANKGLWHGHHELHLAGEPIAALQVGTSSSTHARQSTSHGNKDAPRFHFGSISWSCVPATDKILKPFIPSNHLDLLPTSTLNLVSHAQSQTKTLQMSCDGSQGPLPLFP